MNRGDVIDHNDGVTTSLTNSNTVPPCVLAADTNVVVK
jgi:hypothetical protein